MRLVDRRRLRLRFRDLAALAAYIPVALARAVPLWVTAVFALAFGLSMAGLRPFARGRLWSALALLAMALVFFGLAFRGLLDLVVAAVSFATLVAAHRLLSEPSEPTNQQILLAALLLTAGSAALSGEIWFALCLLAFGTFACLHLGLTVVEGPVERDEALMVGPVFKQVSVGVLLALVGGVAFFIVFPRLSWNLASRRANPSVLGSTTGMADRVRLSGGGAIKTSARVVAKARLDPDPQLDRLDRYWVGRRFDVFDGHEWRGSGIAQPASPMIQLGTASGAYVTQRVELLPAYGSTTLVGLEEPIAFANGIRVSAAGAAPLLLVNVKGEEVRAATEAVTYTYMVISADGPRGERDAERDEATRLRALVVPELDGRIPALSRQVSGGERDPAKIARRLEAYLKSSYGYTLELGDDVDDPLATFLFDRKQGHCEQFATALAIMLRTQRIPARVAAGFFGGLRLGDRYALRAGDAHAWVEAWLGDAGWVTLDATPESGRRGQPPALWAALTDAFERVEELWRQKVLDYALMDQVTFVRDLVRPPRGARGSSPDDELRRPTPFTAPRLLVVLAGVAALATLVGFLRARRRQRLHPSTTFLQRLEARLARASIAQRPTEPIEELSLRLTAEHHPLAQAVARASRRYLEARFGGRELSPGDAAALLEAIPPARPGVQ